MEKGYIEMSDCDEQLDRCRKKLGISDRNPTLHSSNKLTERHGEYNIR